MKEAPYIDLDLASEMVEKAVRSRGEDYIYEKPFNYTTCAYSLPTETGYKRCIVGEAMVLSGIVENDEWFENNGVNIETSVTKLADALQGQGLISGYDPKIVTVLNDMQAEQDEGATWGDVFDHFKAAISNIKDKEEA